MSASQVHVAVKLLEFRLSKAIPDEVQQSIALHNTVQAHQLAAMARELLIQEGQTIEGEASTLDDTLSLQSDIDSVLVVESSPISPISITINSDKLPEES
jgi:arginine/ornithine N-succinyltransferase beta subunit